MDADLDEQPKEQVSDIMENLISENPTPTKRKQRKKKRRSLQMEMTQVQIMMRKMQKKMLQHITKR